MFDDKDYTDDIIILPSRQTEIDNLDFFAQLKKIITYYAENKAIVTICAASSILGKMGILNGKEAICYLRYKNELRGAIIFDLKVITSGNIITASGPGVAKEFAIEIVKYLGTME